MNEKTLKRLRMAAEMIAAKHEEDSDFLYKRLKVEYKTMRVETLKLLELLEV